MLRLGGSKGILTYPIIIDILAREVTMKTILLSSFIFTIYFCIAELLFAIPVKANVTCQPIYGGGQTCVSTGNILIDKKVLNPVTQKMADNLEINDPKFLPNSSISFQINVTNTGGSEIKHADIKDVFPQYVIFTKGPGKFDPNTRTLAFEISNLLPNETRVFTITGRVVEANRLPMDLGIVCNVSSANAITADSGTSQDNTQFCIQNPSLVLSASTGKGGYQTVLPKGGFPVLPPPDITSSPATGPSWIVLFSLIPTLLAGLFLRKKGS